MTKQFARDYNRYWTVCNAKTDVTGKTLDYTESYSSLGGGESTPWTRYNILQ